MDCPHKGNKAAELILEYGANQLSPEAASSFESHLAECANCREAAAAQKALWLTLDQWMPEPVSSDFDAKLFQRIAAEQQQGWWTRLLHANWSWRPAMPVAAACGVLIAAFLLKGPLPSPAGPSTRAQLEPQVQIEQVEHALDDIDMLKQAGFYSEEAPSPHKI